MDASYALKRIAVYTRVSTEEQKKRESIITQRVAAEKYIALHDFTVYGWYADDGVSGTIALEQRPDGARLLRDARDGRFSIVLIYKLSRLGRNVRHIENAIHELEQMDVRVISISEQFDTTTAIGRAMVGFFGTLAELERNMTVEHSAEATNRLARDGTWLGGIIPYGYRVSGTHKESRLVLSEQNIPGFDFSEAEVVRMIFHMTTQECMPTQAIAERLNELGVPTAHMRDGIPNKKTPALLNWQRGTIRNMLTNSTYKGVHRYGIRAKKPRELIEREVPAIVSISVWDEAQAALQQRMIMSTKNATHTYLLRGLITCGLCGYKYTGMYPKSEYSATGAKVYYRCGGVVNWRRMFGDIAHKCKSKAIDGDQLEASIWADVQGFLNDPGAVIEKLRDSRKSQAEILDQLGDQLARYTQSLQAQQAEKDIVIALFRKGRISGADLDRQLDAVQEEEVKIRKQIEAIHEKIRTAQSDEEGMRNAGTMLERLRHHLVAPITDELKQQLIASLVKQIIAKTIVNEAGRKEVIAHVTYLFAEPSAREKSGAAFTVTATSTRRRTNSCYSSEPYALQYAY